MSIIPDTLWQMEFPSIPMPENCTYAMFTAACKQKSNHDALTAATSYIKQLQAIRQRSHPAKQVIIDQLINQEKDNLL